MAVRATDLCSPELLEQIYLQGLKQEFHAEVAMMNLNALVAIMDISLKTERHFLALWQGM